MGLDGAMKEYILYVDGKTKLIWKPGRPSGAGGAFIKDELTAVRRWRGLSSRKSNMTGREMFDVWIRPLLDAFNGGYHTCVSCWDDPARVPTQKHDEQSGRDSRTKHIAYSAGARIVDGGVLLKGQTTPELVDRDRLACSRDLRTAMCRYFVGVLKNYALPAGKRLIVDFEATGPWAFEAGRKWVQLTKMRHPFGEADLMVPFWCRVYRESNIYVETIDSDVFMILLNYWDRHGSQHRRGDGARTNIAYDWDKSTDPLDKENTKVYGYIDIAAMHTAMGDRLRVFLLACVLCGCDYLKKRDILHGVGSDRVFEWAMAHDNPFKETVRQWDFSGLLGSEPNEWKYPFISPVYMRIKVALEESVRGAAHLVPDATVDASRAKRVEDLITKTRETTISGLGRMLRDIRKFYDKATGRNTSYTYTDLSDKTIGRLAWVLQYYNADVRLMTAGPVAIDEYLHGVAVARVPQPWC